MITILAVLRVIEHLTGFFWVIPKHHLPKIDENFSFYQRIYHVKLGSNSQMSFSFNWSSMLFFKCLLALISIGNITKVTFGFVLR